jgi:hypothetical protein
VLFGDSHAMQWFNPLQRIAERRGWRLTTVVKSGCPSIDIASPAPSAAAQANCVIWREAALKDIIAMKPSAVVVANATNYFHTRLRVPSRVDYDESLEQLQAGTRRTLQALAAGAVPVLMLRDLPRLKFEVPTCLARAARNSWYPRGACLMDMRHSMPPEVFAAEKAGAQDIPNVRFLDLSDLICRAASCPSVQNGLIVYRDSHHMTGAYADSLASGLESRLTGEPALTWR